jgi:glycine/D-amino acid oxidase-like deaminating enzyme
MNRPYGVMTGGYRLDTTLWLEGVHSALHAKGLLTYERVPEPNAINRIDHTVIWATGSVYGPAAHGIIPNKGEALMVRMPGWKPEIVIKDEISIVPMPNGLYWIGSYYERFPADPLPSDKGKQDLLDKLRMMYTGPIEMVDHMAGIRPTVLDRRPVIGAHPDGSGDYLFNGMGTKGTSLAPYWADRLISHLVYGKSLPAEVDPSRYPFGPEIQ